MGSGPHETNASCLSRGREGRIRSLEQSALGARWDVLRNEVLGLNVSDLPVRPTARAEDVTPAGRDEDAVVGAGPDAAAPLSGQADLPRDELPRDADGEIDWVTVASMESFPASDAPAWPSPRTTAAPQGETATPTSVRRTDL
jgi:hypothetical protein